MARRKKSFSITMLLVQFLALLIFFEVFIKVIERMAEGMKVPAKELHIAVVVVSVLLAARVGYVLLKLRRNKTKHQAHDTLEAPPIHIQEDSDACTVCGKAVSEKVKSYCINHPGRFKGRIYCFDHQRTIGG